MLCKNRVANGIASGRRLRALTVCSAVLLLFLSSGACQTSRKPTTPTKLIVSNQPLLDLSRGGAGIPLASRDLPQTADKLRESLMSSYGARLVLADGINPVVVAGDPAGELDVLRIDLSNAVIRPDYRPTQFTKRPTLQKAYSIKRFEYQASPIKMGTAEAYLTITADDAQLGLLTNPDRANGRSVMMLTDARKGRLEFSMSPENFNRMLNSSSSIARSTGGVSIKKAAVNFDSSDSRTLTGTIHMEGMWLILPFKLSISGRMTFDEQNRACFTQMSAHGDDVTGALMATFVQPMLDKYNGRVQPLAMFPGGRIKVRDVTIDTNKALNLRVDFGS